MIRVLSSGEVEDVHGNKINNGEKKNGSCFIIAFHDNTDLFFEVLNCAFYLVKHISQHCGIQESVIY